jgi:hypothetical protein
MSDHLLAEVEHVVAHGPLGSTDPVPGCGCVVCLTLAAGGTWEDAYVAREMVQALATLPPADREEMAAHWLAGTDAPLPAPAVLAALATREPGAVREPSSPSRRRLRTHARPPRRPLDIEAARGADIVAVAERLGLGPARQVGRYEFRVRCPFHDDRDPSMTLTAHSGLWYCFPCARGGDVIELVRRVRGVPFADAVRELAGVAA